jgi:hypothetical protein
MFRLPGTGPPSVCGENAKGWPFFSQGYGRSLIFHRIGKFGLASMANHTSRTGSHVSVRV